MTALAFALVVTPASAEDVVPAPHDQFAQICGLTDAGMERLPGEDVAKADAPAAFAADLARSTDFRVVKIGQRYFMRALMPSSGDPEHASILKCGLVFGPADFSDEVQNMSAMLSVKPDYMMGNTDAALFRVNSYGFSARKEAEGQVSFQKMSILMRNIDPEYLKKGAKPVPSAVIQ